MKFRIGDWKVDSRTLVRVEWRKYYPKLIIHERFETHVKWTLRVLTLCGIVLSFLVLPYWVGIIISFVLLGIQQLIERVLFEYTIMIIQPPPSFDLDHKEWFTNGYLLLNPEIPNPEGFLNYFGPVFKTKKYAADFISYLREWNRGEQIDEDNNIIISFILEPDHKYTTYFYANGQRKWLTEMFEKQKKKKKPTKHGKEAQEFVMQTIFAKTIPLTKDMFFYKFRDQVTNGISFNFCSFTLNAEDKPEPLEELKIIKNKYIIRGRWDLTDADIEYHMVP